MKELIQILEKVYPDKKIKIKEFQDLHFKAEIYSNNKYIYEINGYILSDRIYLVKYDIHEMIVYTVSRQTGEISDIIFTISRSLKLSIYDDNEFKVLREYLMGFDSLLLWFLSEFPRFRWYLLSLLEK